MEFLNWTALSSFSGSLMVVTALTQITKDIKIIKKIPTQLWSYIVSFVVLFVTHLVIGKINVKGIILIAINAVLLSLASNGSYDAVTRVVSQVTKDKENKDD